MRNLYLNQITASIQKLIGFFPQFTFYLFGSMARNGAGGDVDLFVEVDEETFVESAQRFYLAEMNPLLYAVNDPDAYFWHYFSPREKRLGIMLEVLDISRDTFNEIVRPLEIHNFDVIFLPKNWRDKEMMKKLRGYTDPYDRNFFENIARDAQEIKPTQGGFANDKSK